MCCQSGTSSTGCSQKVSDLRDSSNKHSVEVLSLMLTGSHRLHLLCFLKLLSLTLSLFVHLCVQEDNRRLVRSTLIPHPVSLSRWSEVTKGTFSAPSLWFLFRDSSPAASHDSQFEEEKQTHLSQFIPYLKRALSALDSLMPFSLFIVYFLFFYANAFRFWISACVQSSMSLFQSIHISISLVRVWFL